MSILIDKLPQKVVIDNTSKVNRRLFLISNDQYTIPVTVSLRKKNSLP